MRFFVVFQREKTSKIFAAFHAVKIALLVALPMLIQQILTCERSVAHCAGELVRVHMQHVMPRQVVQPRVLPGANVTGEFGSLRVTSLVVLQVSLFGEGFLASTAGDLIAVILLRIHMTCQFLACRKFLLTVQADVLFRPFVPLYALQKIWIGHDLVKERVLQFILRLGGGICYDFIHAIGSILC